MTVAKVWDGAAWLPIVGAQGPPGPQGPAGPSTPIPLVAALPGAPVDGQEVYFQSAAMAADGVAWNLRYRAANPFASKWEFLGGPPLHARVATQEATAAASAWADLATVGPQIAVPLTGRYQVRFGATGAIGNRSIEQFVGVAIGATGPVEPFIRNRSADTGGSWQGGVFYVSAALSGRFGFTTGDLARVRYYTNAPGGNSLFVERWIEILPIGVI